VTPTGLPGPSAQGTDVIIHLAAVTSVLASVADPVATHRLNVDATARLLEVARENEVGTFLFASTNAVVGAGSSVGESSPSGPCFARSPRTAPPRRRPKC